MKHVVLRLLHRRADKVVCAGNQMRFGDLLRRPLRRTPVQNFALLNERIHRPHGFFDGRVFIRSMAKVQIEIIDLQALHGFVAGFDHVLAAQAGLIGLQLARAAIRTEINLTRHHKRTALPAHFLQNVTHHDFRLPTGVGFGIVKKIDTLIVRQFHQSFCYVVADLLAKSKPGAK